MLFQVRLYRFSLSNNQAYNNNTNINIVPNQRLQLDYSTSQCNGLPPYPTQLNTFDISQRGSIQESGWIDSQRSLIQGDGYQNYGPSYDDNRISIDTQRRYWSNTNSPVTPTNPFPIRAFRIAENAPRSRKSFPRTFRTSSSAGALLGITLNDKTKSSPSTEYASKPNHIVWKEHDSARDIKGYRSMPTMNNTPSANVTDRKNKAKALVVGNLAPFFISVYCFYFECNALIFLRFWYLVD